VVPAFADLAGLACRRAGSDQSLLGIAERKVRPETAREGGMKRGKGNHRHWTRREDQILINHFQAFGGRFCAEQLNGRTLDAVCQRAVKLGVNNNVAAGRRKSIDGDNLARALEMRKAGKSYRAIGEEFGCCESAATNALLAAQCIDAGFVPAKRDGTGGLIAKDVARLRKMLRAGMKGCDIQLQMAISASAICNHRRKYNKELKELGKRQLPPAGAGLAYSGRKLKPAQKTEVCKDSGSIRSNSAPESANRRRFASARA
jgi:hypothetical protein